MGRVQGLTIDHWLGEIQFVGSRTKCGWETSFSPVEIITQQGVPSMREMNPNLMGAARLQFYF